MKMADSGYIYVLTNESFHKDNWIKIGYAEDVDRRVKELSGTSVPLPYEVYCTYEIPRIQGVKDPDKLLHDLIATLNPGLRISPNREFFEMLPWDAYDMLFVIAQMHGRADKLKRNDNNSSGQEAQNDADSSVDALFPQSNPVMYKLYIKIRDLCLSIDKGLEINPRNIYVALKKNKHNVFCFWAKSGWIEVVLNAKKGELQDDSGLIYDISNRKWSASQYAFRFYDDMDIDAVKNILTQTLKLK